MQANLDLNTKAIDRVMKNQDVMAKQMEETGRAVSQLRLERLAEQELGNTSEDSTSPPLSQHSNRKKGRPPHYTERPAHSGEPPPPLSNIGGTNRGS